MKTLKQLFYFYRFKNRGRITSGGGISEKDFEILCSLYSRYLREGFTIRRATCLSVIEFCKTL
jgi:hypothetical protein